MAGTDTLDVELTAFRLPGAGSRWLTGPLKGNDELACLIAVRSTDGAVIASGEVRTELGAMDRSIGEDYSAEFALDNMIDNLAWRIVFDLTPAGHDDRILNIAKEEGVVPAIQELGWRGELSYGEVLKYSAVDTFRGNFKLVSCAASLAKPDGVPAFIWDFPLFGLHGSCLEIAEQHRWRTEEKVISK